MPKGISEQPKNAASDNESIQYEFPVPEREAILALMAKASSPMSRDDIFKGFQLTHDQEYEGIRRRLRAMERDGQVIFTRRQCYALPETLDLIQGYVMGHRDGFGFVRPEGSLGKDNDLMLPASQMRSVFHGDFVQVQAMGSDKRGRREGRVIRVIKPREQAIVGRFFLEDGMGYVVPDDSRIAQDIVISKEHRLGARMGNVVVVEVLHRATRQHNAVGKITEVLGESMAPGMEIDIALRTHDIPHTWPSEVDKQIAHIGEEVPEDAKVGRVDLRQLPLVTIDGEDARDFDDAVYCERKKSGGWRLWVAIADVSYYVRPSSALDNEAIKRGNSVYFPAQVVPMLPEVLSNGLCSLNPQVDRLCMVCEMTISEQGRLSGYKHYEAVMNSHARLTYTKVSQMLDGNEELRARYAPLVPHLEELHAMYQALKKSREARGAIEFETLETKFVFNADRKIDRIVPVERNDAHKIIEECMILANISSARFMEKHKEPALYRVHDKPGEERLQGFRDFLGELSLTLNGGLEPSPQDYAELAKSIADRPDKELIQTMLLRSMKQAVYQAENMGHFGLALNQYAHFTSPIRRYPDLTLHRGIKYLLAKEAGTNRDNTTKTGGFHYSFDEMDKIGVQCSMTERRADDATRDVADWLKCEYMQDHLGDEFEGVIANVTGFGFFVRLNELNVDGLVHISNLGSDYYTFDPLGQRLIGGNSGMIYRLGDTVNVVVAGINLDDRQIDFELVGTKRQPRRVGKTAKDRAAKTMRKAEGFRHKKASEPTELKKEAKTEQRRKSKKDRRRTQEGVKAAVVATTEADKAPDGSLISLTAKDKKAKEKARKAKAKKRRKQRAGKKEREVKKTK